MTPSNDARTPEPSEAARAALAETEKEGAS